MYTIIVGDDNSLYGSHKEKIIQKEKLFNKICFLVAPHYNGFDMSKCTVTLRYLLPISREFKTETLILSEDRYKEYLKYVLPINTDLSKEFGDIEMNLTFTLLDVDESGNIVQHVRKTTNCIVTVTPIPNWDSIVPDSALSALDQRILKQDAQNKVQDAQIKALESLAEKLESSKVDNLVYDKSGDTLQLSAKGVGVGNKISIKEMLDDGIPVVDLDSNNSSDNNENKNNCDCNHDCNCEDNVVEFGYNDSFTESTDDNNVVEF